MSTRLHIVVSVGLRDRIDAALGPGQSRGDFVRRAVEQALGDGTVGRYEAQSRESVPSESPAPAEQPAESEGLRDLEARVDGGARSMGPGPIRDLVERSGRPAREFRPYPKGGGG